MSGKKELSFIDKWNKIASKKEVETDQLTGYQAGTTTSESQLAKAGGGTEAGFSSILNQASQEQQELESFKIARNKAIEEKAQEKANTLAVQPGTVDQKVKEGLKTDEAFLTFKAKEKERQDLIDKSLWNRLNTSFARQGIFAGIPGNALGAVANLLYSEEEIAQSFVKPGLDASGRTVKEDAKLKQLSKDYETTIKPYIKKQAEENDIELKKREKLIEGINQKLDEYHPEVNPILGRLSQVTGIPRTEVEVLKRMPFSDYFSNLFSEEGKNQSLEQSAIQAKEESIRKLYKDKAHYEMGVTQREKMGAKMKDFVNGSSSALWGASNHWRDYGTVGLHSIVTDLNLYRITQKKEIERTDAEKDALLAYGENVELDKKQLFDDRFWYKSGDGAGSSIVFLESTLLTEGVGGGVKTAVQGSLKGALKKTLETTLKDTFKRKLGVALTEKVIPAAVGLGAQALVSPTTYAAMLKQKIGDVRVVTDKDGTKRVVTSDVSYKQFMKEYDLNKSALEHFIGELEKKENLSPEEQAKLDEYQNNLNDLNAEKETLRPKSWAESFAYGYVETVKEFGTEKFVGKLGDRLVNKIVTSPFVKGAVGKLPFQKSYKAAKEFVDWGQNYVNNTAVGKISSKALYHTGANKVYDGIPGEMIEEIVTQVLPTFRTENFVEGYKAQLRELQDPTFYADIAGQTLVMSGGTTTLGLAGSTVNYRKRNKFYNERAAIREAYKSIDRAVTDDDLAETILMASGGTAFSITDYDHKILTLRQQNTEDSNKAADAIEQKKFFNLAIKAIKTNTLDEFEQTIDKLATRKDSQFSEKTAMNIGLAKQKITEIKKVYERYSDRSNVGNIVDLAAQKITAKQSIETLDKEILTQKDLAEQAYQDYLKGLGSTPSFMPAVSNLDGLLNAEGTTPEEEKEIDKFTAALEKTNDPAIQTYVNLLAARDNMEAARRMTMKQFNEAVSPEYEQQLQKTKAIGRQFQKTIAYIEQNNISDGVAELDAAGKVILTDSFIDSAFKKIDTMGLPKEKIEKMKQDYKTVAKIQARQRQAGSFDRIALLHEFARKTYEDNGEPLDEAPVNPELYQVKELPSGKFMAIKNMTEVDGDVQGDAHQDEQGSAVQFDTREEAEQKITELNGVQDATPEEVANYEKQLESVKHGLYHPIALESDLVTDEYFDNVDTAAPVLLDEFNKTGKVNAETIKDLFQLDSDIVAETMSKVITDSLSGEATKATEASVLDSVEETITDLQASLDNIIRPGETNNPIVTESTDSTEEAPEYISVEEDNMLDPASLMPRKADNFSPDQIKALIDFAKTAYNEIKQVSGQDPTFKDFVYYFVRFAGKNKAEESFDAYKLAWEAANLTPTNYEEVYDEIFEPLKDTFLAGQAHIDAIFKNVPTTVATTEEVMADSAEQLATTEKEQTRTMTFNDENVPVKTSNDRRVSGIALRFGFSAIKYEEVEIKDAQGKGTGSYVRMPILTDSLNFQEGAVDFRELLDYDKYQAGTVVNVGMVPESEWGNIRVYVGRDAQNKPMTKSFGEIYQEKMAADPNFRNSQEFLDTVPVVAYNKQGTPVAHIHETSWYNVWNVSDPSKPDNSVDPTSISMSHQQAIQEAKDTISAFRAQIINNGLNKVTIKEKINGAFYTIEDKKDADGNIVDLIPLTEANPQSVITVQGNQAVLEIGEKQFFENEKRIIINKEHILEKGNRGKIWNVRRIGVDSQGRETWQAFATSSYKQRKDLGKTPLEEIETVKWAWSAYSMFDTMIDPKFGAVIADTRKKNVVGTSYDLTEEQARKIIKDIKDITGYNLMKYQDADAFFSLFFHPKSGNSRAEFGRQVYTATEKDFYLNVSRQGLSRNPQVPMIVNGVVTNTNKTYQDYLKDKLTSGVRSFNIGTADNPKYVTSIQPMITFEYEVGDSIEETPVTVVNTNKEQTEKATAEIKAKEFTEAELIAETEKLAKELGFKNTSTFSALPSTMKSMEALKNIFNLTPGLDIAQEAHLVDFIYNFINTAIDVKYDSKVSKEKLLNDVANSYNEIVAPSRQKVQALLDKLVQANTKNSTEDIRRSIGSLKNMLRTFDSIETNWNVANIKSLMEATGMEYQGQIGIVEKAMEEVTKTSDIKEKQDTAEEEEEEEDITMKTKSFEDNASLTENGKSKTSYRLRRFMSGIQRIDSEGNLMTGFLGLPTYINYNEVYDTIYQLLGSGVYIESNYEIMKAKILEMEKAQPWVKELMTRFDKADAQLRNEFVVNYRKHAVAMKFTMYTQGVDGSRLQVYDTNANEVSRVIINEWKNNFKTTPIVKTINGQYTIDTAVTDQLLAEYNSWEGQGFAQDDAVVRKWLSNFGIDLSDGYWNELKSIGFTYQGKNIPYNQSFEGNNNPIGLLVEYLKKVKKEKNLDFEDNDNAHPFKDMQSVIKALSKGESRYSGKVLSKNFRDGGKNVSGITNPTYATDRIDDLIRSASSGDMQLINDLKSLSISSNSILLELLQRDPDFYKKLEINHLGITAIKEYGKDAGTFSSLTDLNSLDHDITKLGHFQDTQQGTVFKEVEINGFSLRIARMFLPTMSDKTQMLSVATGIFNFMSESQVAFERNEDGNIKFTEDLRNLLYDRLILPEMKRISNFHKNVKATDIKDYDNAAQLFNFFPALNMLTDENGDRLVQQLVTQSVESVERLYKDQLIDVVENTMHSLVQEKMDLWEPFKKLDNTGKITKIDFFDNKYLNSGRGTLEEKFETASYDFILNSVLTNADMFTVIAGDPALFSQDKLFKEVDKPYFATNDNFYTNLAERQGVNIGKRLALLIAPGRSLAESHGQTYNQIFLKDSVDITENAEYLITLFEGEDALKSPLFENAKQTVKEALEEYKTTNATRKAVIRKALKAKFQEIEKIGDYFDIESTDAQEYTTLKEHLDILFQDGKLAEDKYKELKDKADKGEVLTKEEMGMVLQPLKPVYTGQIFDRDEKGNIKNDVARTVYIKSSSFPLIPELTAGTQLDALRVSMEALEKKHGKGVRASYQTANKVGSKIDTEAIDPLNSESLKNLESSMLTLNRKDFRIQQDVPFKSDLKKEDKIAMGTQIFKLLFGDGMMDLKGFSYNGRENYTGQQLYDEFNTTFTKLVQSKKAGLFKELGLNPSGVPINEEQTMIKLQNLLQKEAINRDYPIQDIRSLSLETLQDKQGNTYYDFKTPLWLATNSDRFESLLNAIVTNRLMNHKMPGNSFVAASENGFSFRSDLKDIEKSKVIYFDNFNGKELQGAGVNADGSLRKAQVLVPSKFKDKDGKLIDLFSKSNGDFTYVERRENGTWKLKEGMIAPELLNQFTFRIPTSSHVSASSIEIAGILPPEVGDLIITPKNFTKQMGQDFDVDKLNTYQLHHVVNFKTGKVEVLDEKYKTDALRNLKNLLEKLDLEKIKLQRKLLPAEVAELLGNFGKTEQVDLAEYFGETLLKETLEQEESLQNKYDSLEAKLNEKLLENDFIKIHTSVFNNPTPEVQSKINKVLSMDFARQQADLMQDFISEGNDFNTTTELQAEGISPLEAKSIIPLTKTSFTILSDEYQKKKMGLGSAGKMAIGIYSNYVTFHSLVQQTPRVLRLMQNGEEGPTVKTVTIGKLSSGGTLGKLRTIDGNRSIAEVFAERQNTATDNEKEQILGRVNVNNLTIGVDSLLTLLGFDKTTYSVPAENGKTIQKELSVAYALLSQPILREYVDMMQKGRGITAAFDADLEGTVVNALMTKYKGELTDEELDEITGDELTGDNLVDGLTSNGTSPKTQIAALKTFLDLNAYSKNIAKVQSTLFTNNLGKSIVESNATFEDLGTFSENSMVSNVTALIGDFVPIDENLPPAEGYSIVGDYYVKPTTPQGQIVVEGLRTAQLLWSDFFPYNDPGLKSVINSILATAGVDANNKYKTVEETLSIIKEVKKYIYSWKGLGLYTDSSSAERKRLFMSSSTNTSLAEYLNANSKLAEIVDNKLLNRFTYEVELDGRPSLIKYNNTISDNLDEKYLYNSLAELMIEDKPLPDWNGKPFSTKQLGQELVSYAYLEGGVQQAIQFIKYIPVEYLSEVGINTPQGFLSAATVLQRINTKRNPAIFNQLLGAPVKGNIEKSPFIRQYFQHHPDAVPSYSAEDVKNLFTFDESKESFFLNSEESPKFITIKNKTKSKLKQDKYTLFEHVGNNRYQKISVLGTHGMNEYEAGVSTPVVSIMEKKAPAPLQQDPADTSKSDASPDTFNALFDARLGTVQDNTSATDALTAIANSVNPKSARYKALAQALLPFATTNTQIKIGSTKDIFGVPTDGLFDPNTNIIHIDSGIKPENKESVFMHELIHAMTLSNLKKYYEVDADGFYTILKPGAPNHVQALHDVWTAYIENTDPALVKAAKQKTIDLRASKPTIFSIAEREIGYPSVDIFEFLAVALESEDFQKHLSGITLPGGQNLLEKFIEAIKTILSEIGVEIQKGSLAEKSLNEIFNFIQLENEIQIENAIFASIEIDVDAAEQELFDRAQIDLENASEEAPGEIDFSEDSSEESEGTLMPNVEEVTGKSGTPLSTLGITQEEWSSLTQAEKEKIKDCN